MEILMNKYQTPITEELISQYPEEVIEQLYDCINNVPFIKNLTSPNRPYAKDLPRDENNRIIVNLTNPHIIEDADFFRQPALHYMKHGCYTFLKPNSNPNSEFRKFWDEEIRRCYEGYVRYSDGEWVTGYCYWFLNYCPMMVNKLIEGTKKAIRTESFPFFFEGIYWRFHYLHQAREAGNHAIELAKRGAGKAHPYNEKVFTPNGWKLWEDINIGDTLFDDNGGITKVIDIPFNDYCDIYEVTLRDGRKVRCSEGHLWDIEIHNRKGTHTMSTKEIMDIYKRQRKVSDRNPNGIELLCAIPRNKGIDMPFRETKVDPYTFGLLLGDGSFRHQSCYLTQLPEDLEIERPFIPYNIISWKDKFAWRIDIPNWGNILREYGLYFKKSEDKFIPDEYKYNSREVRLNVLKGLMDSDGTLDKKGRYIISLVSKQMIDDIAFICRSLGYNCSIIVRNAGYKKNGVYVKCLPCYSLTIYTRDKISNLPRKIKENSIITNEYTINRELRTKIIDIKYVGKELAKCVTVDNKNHRYLIGDFITTHNSYGLASIMSHNLILGENEDSKKRVITVLTAYQKEYLSDSKDGTLSKFKPEINFVFSNTPFPRLMLKNSPNEMTWQMGYKDEYGIERGSLNQVMAVSAKDDSEKLRGKRGWILFEEMGSFKGLLSLYDITRKSVEDGDYTFAMMYLIGTAAEDESDFSSAKTLLYNPEGYNIYHIDNVFDRSNRGKKNFGFFFPSYINRAGCYNKDGVSDVVKALLEILMFRHKAKYSADPKSVLRLIAEDPITPEEAIIKVKAAYFPVTALTERLSQIDTDPNILNNSYVGSLTMTSSGEVKYVPTSDEPIRKYGVSNNTRGAIEIFQMPEKNREGAIYRDRYIIGHDPVDNDQAESSSLSSTFVLDLFTDTIVAEYTGRHEYSEDNYEVCRLLCLFYNAKCLYEAHPYSQEVYTPEGKKLWKDIKIGDYLFSPTKGQVQVTDIPIEEEMPIYKVSLVDGREILASDNHIWLVYKGTSKIPVEMTTKQMMESGVINKHGQHKFFIPEHNGVDYEYKNLPIDPYTMGLIIAEGSLTKSHCGKNYVQVSSSQEDMLFYKNNIPYSCKYIGKKGYSWHIGIPDCRSIMMQLNLYNTNSHTKFIPEIYLYSNFSQRMELLKGLMDGDGCAKTKGASIFITCSKQLAEDVLLLGRSLGIKCWLQPSKEGVYRVALSSIYKVFKLPRKVVEQHVYSPFTKGSKASAILNKTAISNIEYSHTEFGKCVTVDSEDGLYLIGDYVVTHNCNKKGLFAYFSKMNCTHLLADTPEYLRDKQLVKYSSFGSGAKGVNASAAINNYANERIREWLLKPVITQVVEDGVPKEVTMPNLFTIKSRALLEELIA